jgi:hypothetical protein
MTLFELQPNEQFLSTSTLKEATQKLKRLIADLQKRSLPADLIQTINSKIEGINTSTLLGKPLEKLVSTTLAEILKLLEKELKLVPQHHYRTQWMVLGMSAFGLPMGVAFGISIGNLGMLGLGLPIGMAIGIAKGSAMDEKAKKKGRQLNLNAEE